MMVFVVMKEYGWGNEAELEGIFSSSALAQEFVSGLPAHQRGNRTIEEWEVDAGGK